MEKLCDFCKVNFVCTNNIVNQISKIWQKNDSYARNKF